MLGFCPPLFGPIVESFLVQLPLAHVCLSFQAPFKGPGMPAAPPHKLQSLFPYRRSPPLAPLTYHQVAHFVVVGHIIPVGAQIGLFVGIAAFFEQLRLKFGVEGVGAASAALTQGGFCQDGISLQQPHGYVGAQHAAHCLLAQQPRQAFGKTTVQLVDLHHMAVFVQCQVLQPGSGLQLLRRQGEPFGPARCPGDKAVGIGRMVVQQKVDGRGAVSHAGAHQGCHTVHKSSQLQSLLSKALFKNESRRRCFYLLPAQPGGTVARVVVLTEERCGQQELDDQQ